MALFKKKELDYNEVAAKAKARAAELLKEAAAAEEAAEAARPPTSGVIQATTRTPEKRTEKPTEAFKPRNEEELPALPEKDADEPGDVLNAVVARYMGVVPVLGPNEAQALNVALLLALLDEVKKR